MDRPESDNEYEDLEAACVQAQVLEPVVLQLARPEAGEESSEKWELSPCGPLSFSDSD